MSDPKNPDTWVPREIFAAYVGKDSPKLLAYYDQAKDKRKPLFMSPDILAILAFPAWLGYRRQWLLWSVFVGMIALLPFVELLAGIEVPGGAFVGMGVAMGCMARGMLLTTATGKYQKLKAHNLEDSQIMTAMDSGAEASVPLAILGGVGSVAIVASLGYLAESLFG